MSRTTCTAILARHLRLHRDLLALRGHTVDAPFLRPAPPGSSQAAGDSRDTPPDALTWVTERQRLLDRLSARDSPDIAAQTAAFVETHPGHAAVDLLRRLSRKESDLMRELESRERTIAAAMKHELDRMAARLATAAQVRAARRSYAALDR